MPNKCCDIVLISVDSNILLGVYKDFHIIESYEKNGKTSDILPQLFCYIAEKYKIENIYYANGPGNFSAIKLTHVFLQTLKIIENFGLYCIDSFYFTKDRFINAYGGIYFFKEEGLINTKKLDEKIETKFSLPRFINKNDFKEDCMPLYILPAV